MKPVRSQRVSLKRTAVAQLIGRLQAIWQTELTLSERMTLIDEALTETGGASQYLSVSDVPIDTSEPTPRRMFRVNREALRAMEISERGTIAHA